MRLLGGGWLSVERASETNSSGRVTAHDVLAHSYMCACIVYLAARVGELQDAGSLVNHPSYSYRPCLAHADTRDRSAHRRLPKPLENGGDRPGMPALAAHQDALLEPWTS